MPTGLYSALRDLTTASWEWSSIQSSLLGPSWLTEDCKFHSFTGGLGGIMHIHLPTILSSALKFNIKESAIYLDFTGNNTSLVTLRQHLEKGSPRETISCFIVGYYISSPMSGTLEFNYSASSSFYSAVYWTLVAS